MGLLLLVGRVGQLEEVGGRVHRGGQYAGKGELGHRLFVRGNGQAAFDDVEDAFGSAPVVRGVVENAVADPIRGEGGGDVLLPGGRQGELAGHAVAVEHEGGRGKPRDASQAQVTEVGVEEVLDSPVGWG